MPCDLTLADSEAISSLSNACAADGVMLNHVERRLPLAFHRIRAAMKRIETATEPFLFHGWFLRERVMIAGGEL